MNNREHVPSSGGVTDAEGKYTLVLTTDPSVKGAAVGKHKVIITIGGGPTTDTKPTFHKQLPERYNRKSELQCDVPEKGRDDANFELRSQ